MVDPVAVVPPADKPEPCQCAHLTDERMGYPPDAKAARETPGIHHTPIRCTLYRGRRELEDAERT